MAKTTPEKHRAISAAWRAANPGKMQRANLLNNARSRAKRKGLDFYDHAS